MYCFAWYTLHAAWGFYRIHTQWLQGIVSTDILNEDQTGCTAQMFSSIKEWLAQHSIPLHTRNRRRSSTTILIVCWCDKSDWIELIHISHQTISYFSVQTPGRLALLRRNLSRRLWSACHWRMVEQVQNRRSSVYSLNWPKCSWASSLCEILWLQHRSY